MPTLHGLYWPVGGDMWVLVLITLTGVVPSSQAYSIHSTMSECFDGRDQILIDRQRWDGHFPAGVQAICMVTDEDHHPR